MPIVTEKMTQLVHAVVLRPLYPLTARTAVKTIVYEMVSVVPHVGISKLTVENSYMDTSYPSVRADGEKYPYAMMKNMIADCTSQLQYCAIKR